LNSELNATNGNKGNATGGVLGIGVTAFGAGIALALAGAGTIAGTGADNGDFATGMLSGFGCGMGTGATVCDDFGAGGAATAGAGVAATGAGVFGGGD
jgi:hypothetical protein